MSKNNKLNYQVFRRLLSHARDYKLLFGVAVVFTLILAILGPLRPVVLGYMVDDFLTIESADSQLVFWAIIVTLIILFEGIFQFLANYASNLFAQKIIRDLRKSLVKNILTFRMKYFDKTPIGALVTRVVSDLEAITEVFSSGMMSIAGDLFKLVFVVVLMFAFDWQLTLMVLLPIPLLVIATRIFARLIRKALKMEREAVNNLNVFVQERLSGMSLVQLFNKQKKEYRDFKEINKTHRQSHFNSIWAYSIFFPVVELLSSLSIAFILVWGSVSLKGSNKEEVTEMFIIIAQFTFWVHMLYRPIRMMADKFNILQKGTVRAERVFKIIDLKNHIQDEGKIVKCDFNQEINIDSVYFAYSDEDWVLEDINLKIESGSTIAFVGATGAGKSSIVNLLGRFYEFQKGKISIGDVNLNDLDLEYLRRNIAIVLQDVFLFSDSVINNITLGDESITRDQVIAAAKQVGAHDFIMMLPDNYDYQVGERGGVLSVGQRQMLAFIRAYVYNPHILILDEATSSVDNESEELIQKATEKLTEGRTSIIIAHRLSTIHNSDKIVVLDKGKIMEIGSHSELLKLNGYYRKLYEMQFVELN